MSRTAENHAWAILARHHYAQETMAVMHSGIMFRALCSPDDFEEFLEEAEAVL